MKNEIIYRQTNQNEFENCLKLISKFHKNSNLNRKFIEWDYSLNPFGKSTLYAGVGRNKQQPAAKLLNIRSV